MSGEGKLKLWGVYSVDDDGVMVEQDCFLTFKQAKDYVEGNFLHTVNAFGWMQFGDSEEVQYRRVDHTNQEVTTFIIHPTWLRWDEVEDHVTPMPVIELAIAALQGDPIAVDAIKDAIKI